MLYIGAGHGGKNKRGVIDYGAFGNNTNEFLECSKIVEEMLNKYKGRISVVKQRTDLRSRIKWINDNLKSDDTYFELHLNAAGSSLAHGAEVFYRAANNEYKVQATEYAHLYTKKMGLWNRGAKPDTQTRFKRLGVIRDVKCKSFLVELGFISNKDDLMIVRSQAVNGLAHMLGLERFEIPEWAQESVEKAKKSGLITNWDNPEEIVAGTRFEHMCKKAGIFTGVSGDGIVLYRAAVLWDRLGILDKLLQDE